MVTYKQVQVRRPAQYGCLEELNLGSSSFSQGRQYPSYQGRRYLGKGLGSGLV